MRTPAATTITLLAALIGAACGPSAAAASRPAPGSAPTSLTVSSAGNYPITASGFSARVLDDVPVNLAGPFSIGFWAAGADPSLPSYTDPVQAQTYSAGPVPSSGAAEPGYRARGQASPKISYRGRLMLVTIEAGGQGAPHVHGGLEALYVVRGQARLLLSDGDRVLNPGDGFSHDAGTAIQDVNVGSGPLVMLAYFVTPASVPFRTDLDHAPGAADGLPEGVTP